MPLIICIVGKSESGKTTLITKLIPELKRRGYKVATIKHVSHDFNLDTPSKDSWQHSQAGSECVVLSSPHRIAVIQNVDHDLATAELARLIPGGFDIVLAEGLKHSKEPKIEVHRRKVGGLACSPHELIAIVTDERLELNVPQFSPDDVSGIIDVIEESIGAPRRRTSTQRK